MTLSLFSLAGKTAVVTGGNSGIGRGIALGFQSAGANIVLTGRNPEKNKAISNELGDDSVVFSLDVRDEAAVQGMISEVVDRFGKIDILVNNAGIVRVVSTLEMSREEWDAVIDTNLTGPFLCAKHAARAMVAQGTGGKIINIGSEYSYYGADQFSSYGASKTGLLGLTRALAIELAPHQIQVNAIIPGWFETDMVRGLPNTQRGDEIRRKTPAGRWGNVEDLVGASVFLASKASDFVTGTVIPVDGGYLISEKFSE